MNNIHMILTVKGGVGKSFIAAILAQYFGAGTYLADTDPGNSTFSSYEKLGAKHINILSENMNIDKRRFDELIDTILEFEGDALIDNGSTSFLPLMSYLIEGDVIEQLREAGKNVIFHAVLVGGIGRDETMRSLTSMLRSRAARVVVWENEFLGPISADGVGFRDSETFTEYADQIVGIVRIPQRNQDTFGVDIDIMTSNKLTFDEVEQKFSISARSRIRRVKNEIYAQLDQLDFSEPVQVMDAVAE